MQEDFLHFVWQYQKLLTNELVTVSGKTIQVLSVGQANLDTGPDFFNARMVIDNQEWAGNVELHLKSSDWYAHHHETDKNYDNVILHVVWEDDVVVFDQFNQSIETLELKDKVSLSLLTSYKELLAAKSWINCENKIVSVDQLTRDSLKDGLLIERLEQKSEEVIKLLVASKNDWESVLFKLLAKSFGLSKNSDSFFQIANTIGFSVFKKQLQSQLQTEALLFGQANLLSDKKEDDYYVSLQKEYNYLKHKYKLLVVPHQLQFFRMRPANFPTIRLSQLASLYVKHQKLWSLLLELEAVSEMKKLFQVTASDYWSNHYVFDKESVKRKKKLSVSFIELLLINVVIPLKYVYAKSIGDLKVSSVLSLYRALKPEKNSIINKFSLLGLHVEDAGDSQALLQLKKHYCNLNRCLKCKIGNKLLYAN